jgi:hypothetical protein
MKILACEFFISQRIAICRSVNFRRYFVEACCFPLAVQVRVMALPEQHQMEVTEHASALGQCHAGENFSVRNPMQKQVGSFFQVWLT